MQPFEFIDVTHPFTRERSKVRSLVVGRTMPKHGACRRGKSGDFVRGPFKPLSHQGSTGTSHEAQQKFSRVTLKPSGTLSIRTSHEYSSAAESRAEPVLRQLGHLRTSTQQSRAICNMRPGPSGFQLLRCHNQIDPTKNDWCRPIADSRQEQSIGRSWIRNYPTHELQGFSQAGMR